MEKKIKRFLAELKSKNKKRFDLDILERYLINYYKGESTYLAKGGYSELYNQINCLKEKDQIKEIKSSSYNGLNPPLKTRWKIVVEDKVSTWDKSKLLRFSDRLDFSYYDNNPIYQTDIEWEYIERIYNFLKSKDSRQWASVEERSLELFYDEKFLVNRKESLKGRYGILKRLKLSYDDLKMKKYGEMFIYWNRGTKDIKNIIILENHSTFFAYKRMAEEKRQVFDFKIDALIFGEGKKIESSFSFIEEIANVDDLKVLYFGDVDPEGFGIYTRLKNRYPDINIELQRKAYNDLIEISIKDYPQDGQRKNQEYLDFFLEEMEDDLNKDNIEKLKYIWDNDLRIPQELITYEYLLKVI